MLEIFEYVRGKVFPKGGDYIFSKMEEYYERSARLMPKLSGIWEISLSNITFEEFEEFHKNYKDKEWMSVKVYMSKSAIGLTRDNIPSLRIGEMSNWEKYLQMVANNIIPVDRKAYSEIYRRLQGNLDKVAEALEKLNLLGKDKITMVEVKKEIFDLPKIHYPRDLILSTLLRGNRLVPRKGSRYSKYHYTDSYTLLDEVCSNFTQEVVFYAIRKFIRIIFENKIKMLKGFSVPEQDLLVHLSIYEISRCYVLFESSSPSQVYALFEILLGGKLDDSTFETTIFAN